MLKTAYSFKKRQKELAKKKKKEEKMQRKLEKTKKQDETPLIDQTDSQSNPSDTEAD